MKSILIFILTFLLSCNNSREDKIDYHRDDILPSLEKNSNRPDPQTLPYVSFKDFDPDTLAYLQHNFIYRKGSYYGKPLSKLLQDLEIPIHGFVPIDPYLPSNPNGLYLNFEKRESSLFKKKLKKTPNKLEIYLQDTVDKEKIRLLVIKNKSNWTKEAEAYYKNKLIKEIMMISISKKTDENIQKLKKS